MARAHHRERERHNDKEKGVQNVRVFYGRDVCIIIILIKSLFEFGVFENHL